MQEKKYLREKISLNVSGESRGRSDALRAAFVSSHRVCWKCLAHGEPCPYVACLSHTVTCQKRRNLHVSCISLIIHRKISESALIRSCILPVLPLSCLPLRLKRTTVQTPCGLRPNKQELLLKKILNTNLAGFIYPAAQKHSHFT